MIAACLLVILCAAAYAALITTSHIVFLLGVFTVAVYLNTAFLLFRRMQVSRPRTIAAGIAAPFVWAVMLFLSYNAQVGLPLACAIACAAGISVWVLMKG